jgi:hypothetical protein
MKRELEEHQAEELSKKVAESLGITFKELAETDWEIDTNSSDDHYLIIKFGGTSSKKVLAKINGIENNQINIPTNSLD